jgi:hypothetical protein
VDGLGFAASGLTAGDAEWPGCAGDPARAAVPRSAFVGTGLRGVAPAELLFASGLEADFPVDRGAGLAAGVSLRATFPTAAVFVGRRDPDSARFPEPDALAAGRLADACFLGAALVGAPFDAGTFLAAVFFAGAFLAGDDAVLVGLEPAFLPPAPPCVRFADAGRAAVLEGFLTFLLSAFAMSPALLPQS